MKVLLTFYYWDKYPPLLETLKTLLDHPEVREMSSEWGSLPKSVGPVNETGPPHVDSTLSPSTKQNLGRTLLGTLTLP